MGKADDPIYFKGGISGDTIKPLGPMEGEK